MKHSLYNKGLVLLIVTLLTATARAQLPVDVGNTANYGAAGWGAGTGTNAFHVSGPYDATSNLATDYFYDANSPSGTAIEISGSTAPGFYTLVLDNGAAATATISNTAGLDIANNLQLLNGITTTSNNITGAIRLAAGATTAGSGTFSATRYIDGYVGKLGATPFTFPVGNAGIYSPISFSNPAGTTLRYTAGDAGTTANIDNTQGALNLATISQLEYYTISSAAPAGSTVTIPYGNFSSPTYVTDPSTLTIAGWDGSKWINLGAAVNSVNATDQTVSVSLSQGLSGFTQIALASTSLLNPLPVTLVSFTGAAVNCTDLLTWKTGVELNSAHYDIEVSPDAVHFTQTGTVASQNLPAGASHSYTVNEAGDGTHYFRLKMIDIDGDASYSKTVVLTNHCNGNSNITVAPNPVRDMVNIYGLSGKNSIVLMDGSGRLVIQQQSAGTTVQTIPVSNLAKGIYFIRIVDENGKVTTAKIVKE